MEYNTWAERIKSQHNSFSKPADAKFGAWTRRIPKHNNPDEEDDASSTSFPELWNKAVSPPVNVIHSAESSAARSHISHINHNAHAQMIAKYQQEMLDLVRGMPEPAYELSLRDIVEPPKIMTPRLEEGKEEEEEEEKEKKEVKTMSRTKSMETGRLLLKMFIPRIPSVLRGKRSTGNSGTCVKVSPKPMLGEGEKSGSEKSTDTEWRNAEFEQMGSSSSCNSSGRRRSSRKLMGCYPFFQTR